MRQSEFWMAVDDEFGEAYGQVLVRDLVIDELNNATARQALSVGMPARTVWFALCAAMDVPKTHWYTAGKPAPKP